jgi:hypothetical protein
MQRRGVMRTFVKASALAFTLSRSTIAAAQVVEPLSTSLGSSAGIADLPAEPSPASSDDKRGSTAPAGRFDSTAPSEGSVVTRPAPAPEGDHVIPRLKLSYVLFSAGNVDGSALPIQALHLDSYALSWRWFRGGFEAEAGRGDAKFSFGSASVYYGMLGVNAGLQFPGRVTPFVEGRYAGGLLAGRVDGSVNVPGTGISVTGLSAATWMYARGADAGIELYTIGRAYLSASLGWVRTTWGSADFNTPSSSAGLGFQFHDVTYDSYLLKLGLGI